MTILYDRQAEERDHPELADAIRELPIVAALRMLVQTERGSGLQCQVIAAGEVRRWRCQRLRNHLPPHVCAGSQNVQLVWTEDE